MKPKLIGSAPVLLVNDVVASADYFRDKVGFTYTRFWGEPPGFCILWRDQYSLMLSGADDPNLVTPHHTTGHSVWDLYFWVDDVTALYDELWTSGAIISNELNEQSYGVREFSIRDLNDYEIAFAQDLDG